MSKARTNGVLLGIFILMIGVAGCSNNLDKVLTLKQFADIQEATDEHVAAREANFQALLADVSSGQISELGNKQDIYNRYGEPVYIKQVAYQQQKMIMWMYRLPVKFMDSDQVLFYFDDGNRLVTHEVRRKDQ